MNEILVNGNQYYVKGQRMTYVSVAPCNGNCKFGTLDHVSMHSTDHAKKKVDCIKAALRAKSSMRVVMAHVIDKLTLDTLKENFEVLSVLKLPIGYNNNYQWHVHIRNPNDETYKSRFEEEGVTNEILTTTALSNNETQLKEAFKAGRYDKSYHIKSGFKKFIQGKKK